MGTVVYTESTCDRCGTKSRAEGAHGGFPPKGWSSITLTRRGKQEGWVDSISQIEGHICPTCACDIVNYYTYTAMPTPMRDPKTGRFIRR